MRLRHVQILVNPSARSGGGVRDLESLRHHRPPGVTVEWIPSHSAEHFQALVRTAQTPDSPVDTLGIAGGDGTVGLLLNALGGPSRVPIGILPTGSGNDFARQVGVPNELRGAYELLVSGHADTHLVDAGEAGAGGPRYCCVASVGLDELALRIIHSAPVRRSKALNIYAALVGMCRYTPRPVRVSWAAGEFSGPVMFVAVTNTSSYGGGFRVSPAARLDDGKLDVCIVQATSPRLGKLRLISQFPRILRGTHGQAKEVILAQSPWVRIESMDDQPLPVCLDSDLPVMRAPIELRCVPRVLPVLVPPRHLQGGP